MTNLIDNALKYTLPGTRVDLTAWRADDAVYVAVDDEGPGIPQEHRTRIFERFTQAGDSPQGRRGFGLGLAYCRSAMTAHGGKIWVEDAPVGTGMRFVFSLPVSTESE
jgi:two-component system sensor histidine kinase KdpD